MGKKVSVENFAIIDTSCLIYLWKLELLQKLVIRYRIVYIPKYVKEEFTRKGKIKRRFQEFLQNYNIFLKICDVENFYDVQLLYDKRRNPKARIDRGEAEVIIQAREHGISNVLINDRKGENIAKSHTLSVKNIFDILEDFEKNGLIENVETKIQKLGLIKK
ncbi:MAG: hypothetical protein M3388_11710 [Acidobacteriota bacterium]|nr:hypothetical protein [Acidobacteriota bacterium]